jgi:hypothetical protein
MARKTSNAKKLEKAAVRTGKELGAIVGRLEKEARALAKQRGEIQAEARKGSIHLMRRASRFLDRAANQLEKSAEPTRRTR